MLAGPLRAVDRAVAGSLAGRFCLSRGLRGLGEFGRGVRRGWLRWFRARIADPPCESPLIVPAVATISGGLLGRFDGGDVLFAVACWAASIGLLGAWALAFHGKRFQLAAILVVLAVACLAAAWMTVDWTLFDEEDLAWRLSERPEPVVVQGTVSETPRPLSPPGIDMTTGRQSRATNEFTVRLEAIRDGAIWRRTGGMASIIVDGDMPPVLWGERLHVFGRGSRPSASMNPGEFDFRERSRALRCLSIIRCRDGSCIQSVQECSLMTRGAPRWWTLSGRMIAAIRERSLGVLRANVSELSSPIAEAMLLGARESLPREVNEAFLHSGTIHVLSVSGLHVGILAISLGWVLRCFCLSRSLTAFIVAACTGVYMLQVGAETPVMRATLMVWLACLAISLGRLPATANALAAAMIIIFMISPSEMTRVGAQLSFLSTGVLMAAWVNGRGMTVDDDPIERLIERSRGPIERWVRGASVACCKAMVVGFAIWCVTTPLIAERFHVVSPIAIPLNLLIAPLVTAAMACGFLCLVFGIVWMPAGAPFGWACDCLFWTLSQLVGGAARIPGGHFWSAGPPSWMIYAGYLSIAALLWGLPKAWSARGTPWLCFAAAWCVLSLTVGAMSASPVGPESLEVTMVSLGHGSGVLVRTSGGRTLLYDAGRLGAPGAATRAVSAILWDARVDRIDHLVLSHDDADHFNGVPELLNRFHVSEIIVSEKFVESPAVGAVSMRLFAARHGIPLRTLAAGDELSLGDGCVARVLHPTRRREYKSDNQSSIVLSVEGHGRGLLLTGDLEGEAMAEFMNANRRTWDVLAAPHHGTKTSLPPTLAMVAEPSLVLVGNATSPSWAQVKQAYEAVLQGEGAVLSTAEMGAVRVTLSRERIVASSHAFSGWQPRWRGR